MGGLDFGVCRPDRNGVSYTIRIPWADEWSHVAILSRDRPVSLAWLWEQHNEHRFPLAKLFWVGSG